MKNTLDRINTKLDTAKKMNELEDTANKKSEKKLNRVYH